MRYAALSARTLLTVGGVALLAAGILAFGRPIEMLVDGAHIESDVSPVATASDRIFVPVRTLADALGAQTSIGGKNRDRIDVVRGRESLRVKVGDANATIDGHAVTLRHAPFRVRGRVMVDLKAVASAFDVRVRYDARHSRVDVQTPGIGESSGTAAITGAETQ